jgi:hypothetical protein
VAIFCVVLLAKPDVALQPKPDVRCGCVACAFRFSIAGVCAVAAEVGDPGMLGRTLLHFVYLDIQEAKFASAKARMLKIFRVAKRNHDKGLVSATRAAWMHMKRVKLVASLPEASVGDVLSPTDPFYRHRVVVSQSIQGTYP